MEVRQARRVIDAAGTVWRIAASFSSSGLSCFLEGTVAKHRLALIMGIRQFYTSEPDTDRRTSRSKRQEGLSITKSLLSARSKQVTGPSKDTRGTLSSRPVYRFTDFEPQDAGCEANRFLPTNSYISIFGLEGPPRSKCLIL